MTQEEYIAILFGDCGFHQSADRRGWLSREFGVRYADELSGPQKHEAIERLKAIKSGLRPEKEEEEDG